MARDEDIDRICRNVEDRIQRFARMEKDSSDRKTQDEVFDKATLLALSKFISSGEIDLIDFPIATGKREMSSRPITRTGSGP